MTGSNVSAPTTTGNVQAGQANVYQPQQQPAADYQYNNLVNSLISQYTAGATPGQQLYTPATGVAALYQGQADNPFFYNLQNQVANNPYYPQALAAAQQAAGYGTGYGGIQGQTYQDLLSGVPYAQINLANQAVGNAPTIANLGATTAGYAPMAYGAAQNTLQNLTPEMQGLINLVGNYASPTANLANQAAGYQGAYTGLAREAQAYEQPYSSLAGQVAGYSPQISALAQQIAATQPQLNQLAGQTAGYAPQIGGLAQQIAATQPQFGALAGQAQGLTPQMQALTSGIAGNIPAVDRLAGQIGGTLPAYSQAAGQTLGDLGSIGQQQRFMTGLEAQPTGAGALRGAAGQLLQTGFDPQNALFNQLTQQTRDQANAINAASGLAGSPYAAGLTSDALRNLDISWQNQQLGRQAQAAGAAGTALGQAQGLNLGQAQLGQDVLGAIGQGTATRQAALADLTGMGSQAAQAAGLYGQAGGLGTSALGGLASQLGALQGAGGLYGQGTGALASAIGGLGAGAGVLGQAGGLYGQGAGLLSNAIGGLGAGAGVLGQAGNLYGGGLGALGQAGNLYGGGLGALGQAGGLYGGAANIGTQAGGLTTGLGNLYGSVVNQLGGAGALNTAAANQLLGSSGLYGQAANIYGQAPQTAGANQALINALTQGTATAGGLPSQTYLGNLQSQVQARNDFLNALSGVIPQMTGAANIGQSAYQLPQTAISDLANYLQLGRGASLAGGALGQIGTQQNQMGAAGLAGLGTLASPLVFGDQGISGALGLGSGGLLGSLGGVDLGTTVGAGGIEDFSGGLAGGGSGLLGLLGGLFGA